VIQGGLAFEPLASERVALKRDLARMQDLSAAYWQLRDLSCFTALSGDCLLGLSPPERCTCSQVCHDHQTAAWLVAYAFLTVSLLMRTAIASMM